MAFSAAFYYVLAPPSLLAVSSIAVRPHITMEVQLAGNSSVCCLSHYIQLISPSTSSYPRRQAMGRLPLSVPAFNAARRPPPTDAHYAREVWTSYQIGT
jgi:hypothetical protein